MRHFTNEEIFEDWLVTRLTNDTDLDIYQKVAACIAHSPQQITKWLNAEFHTLATQATENDVERVNYTEQSRIIANVIIKLSTHFQRQVNAQ